ncbi:MAG: NUDIX domain-containing protein [Candidatus Rhabdochlamydia sp.]
MYISTFPPENFLPAVEVVACFCYWQERFLFLLRQPNKLQGDTWCLPGGKVEQEETLQKAIYREVYEEVGITLIEEHSFFWKSLFVRAPYMEYTLHLFHADLNQKNFCINLNLTEHSKYRWLSLSEAKKFPLIETGQELIAMFEKDFKKGC